MTVNSKTLRHKRNSWQRAVMYFWPIALPVAVIVGLVIRAAGKEMK